MSIHNLCFHGEIRKISVLFRTLRTVLWRAFKTFLFFFCCLALYTEEINLQPFVVTTYCFFLKNQVFSHFSIVKMAANFADVGGALGNRGRFSVSSVCSVFLKFSYFYETSTIKNQQRKK